MFALDHSLRICAASRRRIGRGRRPPTIRMPGAGVGLGEHTGVIGPHECKTNTSRRLARGAESWTTLEPPGSCFWRIFPLFLHAQIAQRPLSNGLWVSEKCAPLSGMAAARVAQACSAGCPCRTVGCAKRREATRAHLFHRGSGAHGRRAACLCAPYAAVGCRVRKASRSDACAPLSSRLRCARQACRLPLRTLQGAQKRKPRARGPGLLKLIARLSCAYHCHSGGPSNLRVNFAFTMSAVTSTRRVTNGTTTPPGCTASPRSTC
jgi:hypothetical protein